MKKLLTITMLTLIVLASRAADQPFVHPLFSDNMVLQRDRKVLVWGWTEPGKEVVVSMEGKRATAKADANGKWTVQLGPFKAGGPFTLIIEGSQKVELKDVLVGDVWVCSGQSNMEQGIGISLNPQQEIANANYPQIRLFTVPKRVAYEPQSTVKSQWLVCTPQTVANGGWGGFSAVGYYFGRHLHQELKVPIGLIHTSWGGTVAEAWTSKEAVSTIPAFEKSVEKLATPPQKQDNPNVVTVLYNGMIAPLLPYGIKGAIWYQGESNASRAKQYQTLLPTMIRDWRARFGSGDFPFLIVSLANFMATKPEPTKSQWAELREAQALTAQTLRNCGLAIAIDIGDEKDIHPKNKQDVGRRLGLVAQAIAYGQKIVSSGPVYRSMKIKGNTVRLSFDHIGGGLVAKGDKLQGFAIAGDDKKYVWADAVIEKDTIVVSSPKVEKPVSVHYAWADNPVCNLYNKAGLPAVPFRADGQAKK